MQILEDNEHLLGLKDGYHLVEEKLGLRLIMDSASKYPGAAHYLADVKLEVPEDIKLKLLEEKR